MLLLVVMTVVRTHNFRLCQRTASPCLDLKRKITRVERVLTVCLINQALHRGPRVARITRRIHRIFVQIDCGRSRRRCSASRMYTPYSDRILQSQPENFRRRNAGTAIGVPCTAAGTYSSSELAPTSHDLRRVISQISADAVTLPPPAIGT